MEWVAISFLNEWKWKVKVKSLSRVLPLATPWTAAYQAPPSVGFSRQEHWSRVPLESDSIIIPSNKANYDYNKKNDAITNICIKWQFTKHFHVFNSVIVSSLF